jgi:hypothetical protein
MGSLAANHRGILVSKQTLVGRAVWGNLLYHGYLGYFYAGHYYRYNSDRFINAEKLYGILHILGALVLFSFLLLQTHHIFLGNFAKHDFYMPTLSLSITVAYSALKNNNKDVVKDYPLIRIWGTVGFIAAFGQ